MANSSSSSSSIQKHDVFLSFRGIDTRKNFIGFLYKELDQKGINTFKDDKKLETGNSISLELIQAIEESRFAIVVVSENYASSSWCLEELAKIMECEEQKSLTAIPIFYEVNPSHVRWQKGKFAEHLKKHERRENPEKVKRWRDALTKLANKSGMDSRNWEDNVDLIGEITKDILNRLNSIASSDFIGLIGMDVHLGAMYSLLGLKSNNEVRMIGIWGMGGVGKTTLGRYVYENIRRYFQTCCFLEDVKKIYHDHGASGLQRELLSRIQGEAIRNLYLGSNVINERLGRQKVLLVVDDVDDVDQLDALAKEDRWFGPGSRVIVTTRDKHLLDSRGIKHVYEAKCLEFDEALKLFCQFAFKQNHPFDGFQSLSTRVVRIADRLPLALKVFGSFLCGRSEEFWESAIYRLKMSLDKKIMKILKISYDGLHEEDKHIFLHVACFFDGEYMLHVNTVMDVFDRGAKSGIELLAEKCLISISMSGYVSVHDLLKQMGREIVCQQSPHDPRKRIILWKPDDIYKVLSNKRESETVEAISLDMDGGHKLIIGEKTFEKVPNLRSLRIRTSSIDGETKIQHPHSIKINFSDQLSYLSWFNCPSNILQFCANNLVKLKLRESKFEKLWEDPPCLENLKEIDISGSKDLKEFPDLSKAPNLQVVRATYCTSLTEIPSSICSLDKLRVLNLWHCRGLQRVSNNLDMKSLEDVCLSLCPHVKIYPEYCQGVKHLFLYLKRESKIPESIGRLSYLKDLVLQKCHRLKHLPDTIGDLVSLQRLWLFDCPMLQSIPESIGHLSNLEDLELRNCERLKHLPNTIGDLISLKSLKLIIISRAKKSDDLSFPCPPFSNFPSLMKLHLINLSMLKISSNLGLLTSLEELDLSGNDFGMIPASIKQLTKLTELKIDDCMNLYSLPELPPNIEVLSAYGCAVLAKVSEVFKFNFTNKSLMFANCFKLKEEMQLFSKLMASMVGDKALVVLPGSEVPSCFDHQNKGSSLMVGLPFGPSSIEVIGFVACVMPLDHLVDVERVEWNCQYTKENCSTSVLYGELYLYHLASVPSGHMLFLNGDIRLLKEDKEMDFDHISFEFSFMPLPWRNNEMLPKIKECGVCLQYTPSSSSSSSSSLATCDANSTSGPWELLEFENNAMDSQVDEVAELSLSTKKQKLF